MNQIGGLVRIGVTLLVLILSFQTWANDSERDKRLRFKTLATCAEIKETRGFEAATRVRRVNEFRYEFDLPPYIKGDDYIKLAISHGVCEELVIGDLAAVEARIKERREKELLPKPQPNRFDREKLVQEIASLEARIAKDQQALAKMPRIKRMNSMTTRSAAETAYLNMWRAKCERILASNYPPGGLEGEVLMLVSILSDGSLQEVRVLKPSGHKALDRAALMAVRQAAPYKPFPVEMRKAYDQLEFTRTWQFTKTGSTPGRY